MKVSDLGVKFYNLTSGRSFPTWLSQEQRRKLSKDDAYNNHVMLLQDFTMPAASQQLRLTRDQRNLYVTGVYPPQTKCYELSELSLKFSRHMDHEVLAMEILTDDFSKVAYLGVDRFLSFHAKYGDYHTTRVPIIGRDLCYDRATCDLFVVGSSPEIWALNLEAGKFLSPIVSEFDAINVMAINPLHSLLAFGGTDGVVECRDPRAPGNSPLARLDIRAQLGESSAEISALEFDSDGLHFGVGTSTGHVLLYDLRSRTPLFQKDHRNELPIHTIRFVSSDPDRLLSADKKVVKFWNKKAGTSFANLETDAASNDVLVFPDSGLVMVAGERERTMAYYCPTLGKAPRWCSFLDNVTEELEDRKIVSNDEIYEDYTFLTREAVAQVARWGVFWFLFSASCADWGRGADWHPVSSCVHARLLYLHQVVQTDALGCEPQ
jgi:ribosome biogenesis protein ENP2